MDPKSNENEGTDPKNNKNEGTDPKNNEGTDPKSNKMKVRILQTLKTLFLFFPPTI